MAVARWRLQRAWVMETALLDNQMDLSRQEFLAKYETPDEPTRAALAFRELTENSPSLNVLLRYEARLTRQLDRCLKRLADLRASREKEEFPSEPSPINEQLNHDPQLQPSQPAGVPLSAPVREIEPRVVAFAPTPAVAPVPQTVRSDDPDPATGPAPSLPRAA